MDWVENKKRQCSFTVTHKHKAILHNSPPKVENRLGRERGKAVLISNLTLTYKHNTILHNSLAKVENGMGREQRKEMLISNHTLTCKHNADSLQLTN